MKMQNKALLGTTHKLPNSNGLSSLHSSIVCPWVGPRTLTFELRNKDETTFIRYGNICFCGRGKGGYK